MPDALLICIVDDDESILISLDTLLRSVGFRAQGFSSAEAFLSSGRLQDTACLLIDVRMAGGMNGLDLQQHLAASNWHIPSILITSHVDDDVRARAIQAGAVAFLYKPFREKELFDAIDIALKHS